MFAEMRRFPYYLPAPVQDVQRDLASVTQVARANQSPPGNIDPASLNQLPPEIREQLLNQIQEETRKQEMLRAYEQQNLVDNQEDRLVSRSLDW